MTNSARSSGVAATRRLFLGIEMPDFVQARLAGLQTQMPGARWQWPADMHLTLRFLGSVPADQRCRISEAMRGLDFSPFDIRVHGVGSFAGKVLWAAIQSNGYLDLLRRMVDERLAQVGIPVEEGDFVPHVTLARTRKSARSFVDTFLVEHRTLELTPWTVRHLTLFNSEPDGFGPDYRVVERYALGKESA